MNAHGSAVALGAAALFFASPALAQDHAHHDNALSATRLATSPPPDHDMSSMDMSGHDTAGMDMAGMDMSSSTPADGSGTSRLPGAGGGHHGVHLAAGDWMVMLHGQVILAYSDQGGPRGSHKAFFTSHLMATASRPLSDRVDLQLRAMASADPLIGARGYPLLFQTGETAGGAPLIDRQHPHDLFGELSARLDVKLGDGGTKVFVYGGPVGEPALGPAAYFHRASARLNPETPLTHHWFDSTHVSFGVVTAGIATNTLQFEASAFRGREPDERRWDIETPKLDSWSVRATWNPGPAWSASLSYGWLKSVEALHPDENESRLIGTIAYVGPNVAVTAGYGRKDRQPGRTIDAVFAEAHWDITARHALFGRFENVNNDELFPDPRSPLHDTPFRVRKFALGYAYSVPMKGVLKVSIGALGSVYAKPAVLDAAYGKFPASFVLFARFGLGH